MQYAKESCWSLLSSISSGTVSKPLFIPVNQTPPDFVRDSLEAYLTIRGQEYIAALRREPGVIDPAEAIAHGVPPEELRDQFGPGAGMDHPVEDAESNRGFFGGRKSKKDVIKK